MAGKILRASAAVTVAIGMSGALRADSILPPDFCDTQALGSESRTQRRDEAFLEALTQGALTLVPNTGESTLIRSPGHLYPTHGKESGEENCQFIGGEVVELDVRRGYPVTFFTRPGAIVAAAPAASDSGYGVRYLGEDESGNFWKYEIAGPEPETLNDYTSLAILVIDINQLEPAMQIAVAKGYPDQLPTADD